MRLLSSFLILSSIYARELSRSAFCLLMTLTTVTLTIVLPLAFAYTFGDTARRLARDGGLSFQLMAGIIIAAYAACAITTRERNSGTEAITLSKPVSPTLLFLSRYAGIAVVLLIFSVSAGTATMLADRIAETFTPQAGSLTDLTTAALSIACILVACILGAMLDGFRKANFHSATFYVLPLLLIAATGLTGFYDRFGHWTGEFRFTPSLEIVPATLLVTCALFLFCAIALFVSIRFKPVTVTMICFVVLAAGLAAEWLISQCASAFLCSLLACVPNWQRFWVPGPRSNVLSHELATTLLYTFLYIAAVLTVGCLIFERSEHSE